MFARSRSLSEARLRFVDLRFCLGDWGASCSTSIDSSLDEDELEEELLELVNESSSLICLSCAVTVPSLGSGGNFFARSEDGAISLTGSITDRTLLFVSLFCWVMMLLLGRLKAAADAPRRGQLLLVMILLLDAAMVASASGPRCWHFEGQTENPMVKRRINQSVASCGRCHLLIYPWRCLLNKGSLPKLAAYRQRLPAPYRSGVGEATERRQSLPLGGERC